jgi:hypothetical protein
MRWRDPPATHKECFYLRLDDAYIMVCRLFFSKKLGCTQDLGVEVWKELNRSTHSVMSSFVGQISFMASFVIYVQYSKICV